MKTFDFSVSAELTVKAETENLPQVQEFVTSFLERNDASAKAIMQIDISVEEIFVNIASYAYGADSAENTCKIVCGISSSEKAFYLTFIDRGKPYDPLKKSDPTLGLAPSEMKEGGWGIYMVKQLVDGIEYEYEYEYEYSDGCNKLRLKKYI